MPNNEDFYDKAAKRLDDEIYRQYEELVDMHRAADTDPELLEDSAYNKILDLMSTTILMYKRLVAHVRRENKD